MEKKEALILVCEKHNKVRIIGEWISREKFYEIIMASRRVGYEIFKFSKTDCPECKTKK